MKLRIVSSPGHIKSLKTIYIAARTCYSEKTEKELEKEFTIEKAQRLIAQLMDKGHHSVIEHCSITFAIEGISRACGNQLVRHRICSISQQSQRFCKVSTEDEDWYVIPESFIGHTFEETYRETMKTAAWQYETAIQCGIPKEDARFMLPNACKTNVVFTMNFRELLHFFQLRCCLSAQWEIREMAYKMLDFCKLHYKDIFEYAGPPCVRDECKDRCDK